MKPVHTKPHLTNAARLGRWFGGLWRAYLRREQRAATWLAARGVPGGVVKALFWIAKLIVLGALLYLAFWLALVLLLILLVARATEHTVPDDGDNWPFKSQEELRNTPGYDPVLYGDVAHPDYPDDEDG